MEMHLRVAGWGPHTLNRGAALTLTFTLKFCQTRWSTEGAEQGPLPPHSVPVARLLHLPSLALRALVKADHFQRTLNLF